MAHLSYKKLFAICAQHSDEARARLDKKLSTAQEPVKSYLKLIVSQQQNLTDILAIYARTGPEEAVNKHLEDDNIINTTIMPWRKGRAQEEGLYDTLKTLSKINNAISEKIRHDTVNNYSDDIKLALRSIVDVIDEYNCRIATIIVAIKAENID